jgi:anaphase-promoting complex subunit 1
MWRTDNGHSCIPNEESAPSHGLSQVVLQGSLVNLEVTCPAATMALMLIFLQTNDESVASVFELPRTAFGLDFVRPFFILLRVLARSLIMWDGIEPTMEWVHAQLPAVLGGGKDVLQHFKDSYADGKEFDWEAVLLGHIHGVAGAALALALRFAGM